MTRDERLLMRLLVEHSQSCHDQYWCYDGNIGEQVDRLYFCNAGSNRHLYVAQSAKNNYEQVMDVVLHSKIEQDVIPLSGNVYGGFVRPLSCVVKVRDGCIVHGGKKYNIIHDAKYYIGVMAVEWVFDGCYVCSVDAVMDR